MTSRGWAALLLLAAGGVLLMARGTIHRIAEAIGMVESGGRYDAIGPATARGNRAYGKYQVMDFNIPTWTSQIIGRSLTPQEWLADHNAQDTVVRAKLSEYYALYKSVEDVASMWFSGRPLAQAGSSADVTGTTVPAYVQRVLDAMA